jgi:hypothetical protein
MHKFPQCFCELTLARSSCFSYDADQIDREEELASQCKDGGEDKTESTSTELNREEKLRDSAQWDGEGNTTPVSIQLERGARFAAEFKATRVKPSCCWTKAETKSFAVHSKIRRG